jgi:DNA (cytosine-5)-methyltransferase 1
MIRFFDMFAGVGGFRAGLMRAGGYECIGHCEIDKYADAAYRSVHNTKESEVFYEDATKINTDTLPEFDLLCAGFPCQAFSIAGRRQGFLDPRGTLFFEIARVARARRPAYLLLENVPGLLSHDKGRTFAAILHELCLLGYSVEWQVLNSKDFGVPQSRRRVYIVGYLDRGCAGKVLPVRDANTAALIQLIGGRQDSRVYDPEGLAKTLLAKSGGSGGKTGLYFIDLSAKEAKITDTARCLTARYDRGVSNRTAEGSGVIEIDDGNIAAHAVLTPEREKVRQNGRRIKNAEEPMFTLTSQDRHGVLLIKEATKSGYKAAKPGDSVELSFAGLNTRRGRVGNNIAHTLNTGSAQGVMTPIGRIRRLMPRECFRLQGFSENQIDKLLENSSDAQAYKQAGNAVTVNVVHALGLRLKTAHEGCVAATRAEQEAAA